jgi:hypothetical protein
MIENREDVLKMLCAEDEEEAKRNVYKYTDCGAWINFGESSITVGSIVEGCDVGGTDSFEMEYPFSAERYQENIDEIERQADLIWDWANVEREDGQTDAQAGLDWPTL